MIFYCEAKGTPPLDYVWLCNSVVLCKGQDNQLKVSANLETEGVYQCRVENLFGSKPSEGVEIKVGEYKVFVVQSLSAPYTIQIECVLVLLLCLLP